MRARGSGGGSSSARGVLRRRAEAPPAPGHLRGGCAWVAVGARAGGELQGCARSRRPRPVPGRVRGG